MSPRRARRVVSRDRLVGLASAPKRFAERAEQVRRRPRRIAALASAAIVPAVAVTWLVVAGPLLVVRSIQVEGVPAAEAAEVQRGLLDLTGTSLVRLDTDGLTRRLGHTMRYAAVDVGRTPPSTVVVRLRPRQPVVAVPASQGGVTLVDVEGVAFARVGEQPAGVPLLRAVPSSPEALRAAAHTVAALPPSLRQRVRDVGTSPTGMVEFRVGDTLVRWGDPRESERKARIVDTLMRPRPPKEINVTVPDRPAVLAN